MVSAVLVTVLTPQAPLAGPLRFTPLPPPTLAIPAGATASYLRVELAKR
jgi:hypothetical protein